MTTTRSQDGTLPSRSYQAVINGTRMSASRHRQSRNGREGTPQYNNSSSTYGNYALATGDMVHDVSRVMCRLATPNYKDELSQILGDDDEPYYGLFAAHGDASDTTATRPSAEDRALCQPNQMSREGKPNRGLPNAFYDVNSAPSVENTKMSIHFAREYAMDAWYRSAYPAEYTRRDYLSVCGYCLHYTMSDLSAERHDMKCCRRVPPGREIYRDGELSMWEVDGLYSSLYCQNLCLLAKSFLSSKSLYKDVQPFFFYVLTKSDEHGARFLGYFSKQKMYSIFKPDKPIQCVSCIVSMPFTQSLGYGQFLIEFSYLLAIKQQATGSPETPLSFLGEKAFRSFWKRIITQRIKYYLDLKKRFSISSLSIDTGIHINHVVLALEDLGWLTKANSRHNRPVLKIDHTQMIDILTKWDRRNQISLKPELLVWVPLYE